MPIFSPFFSQLAMSRNKSSSSSSKSLHYQFNALHICRKNYPITLEPLRMTLALRVDGHEHSCLTEIRCSCYIRLLICQLHWLIQGSMSIGLRFLRPYLYPCFRPASIITSSAHLRFYNASQQKSDKQSNDAGQLKAVDVHQRIHEHFSSASYQQPETQNDATPRQKSAGIQRRARELSATGNLRYPRIKVQDGSVGCRTFVEHYDSLNPNESRDGEEVSINGMPEKLILWILAYAIRKDTLIPSSGPKASLY